MEELRFIRRKFYPLLGAVAVLCVIGPMAICWFISSKVEKVVADRPPLRAYQDVLQNGTR